MLVPSKKELTITGRMLPMKWTKHEEETVDEMQLAPCLEVEVDIISNGALRRTSALLRNCMKNIVIDLGITIEKPCITDAEEPSACIGLFRFNNIDIDKCPHLPKNRRLAFGDSRKMNTLSSISDDSHT
jgi:Protein ENHANCED DISEASE RESISTANCE 2, C-terminal